MKKTVQVVENQSYIYIHTPSTNSKTLLACFSSMTPGVCLFTSVLHVQYSRLCVWGGVCLDTVPPLC